MFCAPDDFEFELARRTVVNLQYIEKKYTEQKKQGLTDAEITDVFEVTQLINSFIGLLVIPRGKFLDHGSVKLPKQFEVKEAQMLLERLEQQRGNRDKYINTYKDRFGKRESLNPWTISRHLRNAISHDRLTILPQSIDEKGSITGFIFEDKDEYNDRNERFRLSLTIHEIKILLLATANTILGQFPEKYKELSLELEEI